MLEHNLDVVDIVSLPLLRLLDFSHVCTLFAAVLQVSK